MIEYKKLPTKRWNEFKDIRLEALKHDWIAFVVAYEDEMNLSEKEWKEKIKNIIFALNDNIIVGLVEYKFETLNKMRHVAYINDLYIKKNFRGRGIGKKLMEEAILKIRANSEIEKIKLIADPVQKPTISLYQKLGFKKIALIKKELKYKGKYYDDLHMEKWLEDDCVGA